MTARQVVVLVGAIAVATWGVTSARSLSNPVVSNFERDDSQRPGPDSARIAGLLDALGKTDRVVCEMVADQIGNFWMDDDGSGLGRFSDVATAARSAKDSLAGRVTNAGAINFLASRMNADDPCVRRLAAKMLGRSTVKADRLLQLLDDGAPRISEAAAFAIGSGERKEARAALERTVTSRGGAVAAMAAWALGEIHDSGSVPVLVKALRSENGRVRHAAMYALGEIRADAALGEIERLLHTDPDVPVRVAAARAIGEIGAESSVHALSGALDDGAAPVRYAAAAAFSELHDVHKAPEALVRAATGNDAKLRRIAARALTEIADPATINVFIGMLTSDDRELRLAGVHALREISSPRSVADLVRMLKDPDAEVRRAAAEVLGELKLDDR